MLRLYRRHRVSCPQKSQRYRRCSCSIYVEGTLAGEYVNKSLDLTSWTAASDLIAKWNEAGEIGAARLEVPSISEAVTRYFEDCAARRLSPATIQKLKILLEKRLLTWCAAKGCTQLRRVDLDALRQFRATWPDSPLTAAKNLERLRSFFYFCLNAGWVRTNPAKAIKPPKLGNASEKVRVFSPEEIGTILAACDRYPEKNSYGHDNPARVRAFVLTLRYSGLRIGDCVALRKEHLQDDRLFLRTQKSGTSVYIPLPEIAADALREVENGTEHSCRWRSARRSCRTSACRRRSRRTARPRTGRRR